MKKEILLEINRFREIIGLKLLSESKVPTTFISSLAEMFGKTEDDFIEYVAKAEDEISTDLKRAFTSGGDNIDDIMSAIKNGSLSDDVFDSLTRALLSSTPEIRSKTAEAFIKEYPTLTAVQRYTNDEDLVYNLISGGKKNEVDKLINKINDLDVGDDVKEWFTENLNSTVRKAEDKFAKSQSEANSKIAKEIALAEAQMNIKTSEEMAKNAKTEKVKTFLGKMKTMAKENKLPLTSDEYEQFEKYCQKIIAESPDAEFDELIRLGQTKFDVILKSYQTAQKEGAEATKEFWKNFASKFGRGALKFFYFANLSKKTANPGVKAIFSVLGWAALSVIGYGATKFAVGMISGDDLNPQELDLLKTKVKNILGECVNKDSFTIRFVDTKFQSDSDVFKPSDTTGKAVIEIKDNNSDIVLEFDETMGKFVKYGTKDVINCSNTPGLGKGKPADNQLAATGGTTQGTPLDGELLAAFKKWYEERYEPYTTTPTIKDGIITVIASDNNSYNFSNIGNGKFNLIPNE